MKVSSFLSTYQGMKGKKALAALSIALSKVPMELAEPGLDLRELSAMNTLTTLAITLSNSSSSCCRFKH